MRSVCYLVISTCIAPSNPEISTLTLHDALPICYHVWLVHDLHGSYEQQPPNLLEELRRDRRWCQGNLQNARLIAERSEEHTSELQSHSDLVCRLLLEKKNELALD